MDFPGHVTPPPPYYVPAVHLTKKKWNGSDPRSDLSASNVAFPTFDLVKDSADYIYELRFPAENDANGNPLGSVQEFKKINLHLADFLDGEVIFLKLIGITSGPITITNRLVTEGQTFTLSNQSNFTNFRNASITTYHRSGADIWLKIVSEASRDDQFQSVNLAW